MLSPAMQSPAKAQSSLKGLLQRFCKSIRQWKHDTEQALALIQRLLEVYESNMALSDYTAQIERSVHGGVCLGVAKIPSNFPDLIARIDANISIEVDDLLAQLRRFVGFMGDTLAAMQLDSERALQTCREQGPGTLVDTVLGIDHALEMDSIHVQLSRELTIRMRALVLLQDNTNNMGNGNEAEVDVGQEGWTLLDKKALSMAQEAFTPNNWQQDDQIAVFLKMNGGFASAPNTPK
jgi:hypothetical protein